MNIHRHDDRFTDKQRFGVLQTRIDFSIFKKMDMVKDSQTQSTLSSSGMNGLKHLRMYNKRGMMTELH